MALVKTWASGYKQRIYNIKPKTRKLPHCILYSKTFFEIDAMLLVYFCFYYLCFWCHIKKTLPCRYTIVFGSTRLLMGT